MYRIYKVLTRRESDPYQDFNFLVIGKSRISRTQSLEDIIDYHYEYEGWLVKKDGSILQWIFEEEFIGYLNKKIEIGEYGLVTLIDDINEVFSILKDNE